MTDEKENGTKLKLKVAKNNDRNRRKKTKPDRRTEKRKQAH